MFFLKPEKNEIPKRGALHALAAFLYVFAIATLMTNLERVMGPDDPDFAPVAMLMLFVLSAAVMGLLVFGKPVMLYIDGKKREAVQFVAWTIGALAAITLCTFLVMIAVSAR